MQPNGLTSAVMARVIVAGTYDPSFGRNRRVLALLDSAGHDVVRCHADLWRGDRYEIPNRRLISTAARAAAAYPTLIWRFLRAPRGDVALVLYPGWFDVVVLAPLARLRRMPVLFDPFISVWDTVVSDRGLVGPGSVLGRLVRMVDRASLRLARRVIADTPNHADFYANLARIDRARIGVVWVGADDDVFRPRPHVVPASRRILFYGTFIKLHGIDVIVRAAKLLEDDDVEVRIIGTGQEEERIADLLRELQPANVQRIQHVPRELLADEIAAATVCLGIFGTTAKARRVVPNKVFECVAVGRPVVTADTEGIRSAFTDDEIAMVPPGDPDALANEIRRLLADATRREEMAVAAREHYVKDFATDSLVRALNAELEATTLPRH
jgi:glycosyltransferase involved in cell wall biosynthesis